MIKDIFNNSIIKKLDFNNVFIAKVNDISNFNKDLSIKVYINELNINLNNNQKLIENQESILNNSNLDNINSVKVSNSIIAYPMIINNQLDKPNIGDEVLIIFLDGDPKKCYYLNIGITKESRENYIKKHKMSINERNVMNEN